MLSPDHQVDLPQQYTTTRATRSLASISKWLIRMFAVAFIVMFAVIGHFPFFITTIVLGYLAFVGIRRSLVRRALLRYRGKLCPCCWHRSEDPKPGCRGCDSPAGRHAHRVYWRLLRLTVVGAEQWFGDQFRIDCKPPAMTRLLVCLIGIALSIPILTALYVVLMTVLFHDLSWISGMSSHGFFWMLYVPALLVSGYFAKRRVGKTQHCAACEYQLAPVGPKPDACPECGADLSRKDAVAKGQQIGTHWGALIPMVVFILVGFFPLINLSVGWQISPSKLVPTHLLIDHVVNQQSLDYEIEKVLHTRRLSDQDIDRLLNELEKRMLNGANFGTDGNDPAYWGMDVRELILAEFDQRTPSHQIALKLLKMEARFTDKMPYGLERWVQEAVQGGVFSQAEIQAAEMLRPIKQISTFDLVNQYVGSAKSDLEAYDLVDEIETRQLDDQCLDVLLTEMDRRLLAVAQNRLPSEEAYWASRIDDAIADELNRRKPSREIELKLLGLYQRYDYDCPYRIRKWVKNAIDTGVYTQEELNQEPWGARHEQ